MTARETEARELHAFRYNLMIINYNHEIKLLALMHGSVINTRVIRYYGRAGHTQYVPMSYLRFSKFHQLVSDASLDN